MRLLRSAALLVLLAVAPAGCDARADASHGAQDGSSAPPLVSADAAAPRAPAASASSKPSPSASASASSEKGELKVLAFVFTSDVKKREPTDELKVAKPGQRVWGHVTIRNRTGETQPIALVFRVGGVERAKVELKVESSWSYRTWGYVTLRSSDLAGDLVAEVRDGSGKVLETGRLLIKGDVGSQGTHAPTDDL